MREAVFKPGDIVDRYRIVASLGSGGTASVYDALQIFLERRVALKILQVRHVERDDVKRRMRTEAIVLSRIRHPNVVAVQDAGITDEGLIFIAMDLLEGQTLREVLRSRGFLSIPDALHLALQIADGVQAAHELDVIHRDLKPENVFIQRDNQLKVLDLGTAKFFGFHLETTDKMRWVGTPAYMSPEHLQGLGVTARSDVYSLGLILYEMIAGRHPFVPNPSQMPSLNEIGWMQIFAEPTPLPQLLDGFPDDVWQVIRRAIAKKPTDRFPSMHQLGLELRRAEHDYAQACRERGLSPARRHMATPPPPAAFPVTANHRTTERMDVNAMFDTAEAPSGSRPPPAAQTTTEPLAQPAFQMGLGQARFDMSQSRTTVPLHGVRPRLDAPPAIARPLPDEIPTHTAVPVPAAVADSQRPPKPERATPALGWATRLDGWLPIRKSALVLTAIGIGICAAIPIGLIVARVNREPEPASSASLAPPKVIAPAGVPVEAPPSLGPAAPAAPPEAVAAPEPAAPEQAAPAEPSSRVEPKNTPAPPRPKPRVSAERRPGAPSARPATKLNLPGSGL